LLSKRYIVFICFFILFRSSTKGQDRITTNPDSAGIVTSDIDHFWEAYDSFKNQQSTADSLKTLRTIFIDRASEGLRQYMKAANCYELQYLETVRTKKNDYLAVRKKTQMVNSEKRIIIGYLKKFKQLYPDIKIPVICYTIGIFQVGGTQFENTLFIGCETDAMTNVEIPAQSIHELSHFQQIDQNPVTNLDLAMIEGGAEFLCYQVTGKRTLTDTWSYGLANEFNLWKDFEMKKDSAINMQWFQNITDTANRRPGSLGYFIGFRICESYLQNHDNKKLAMTDIIEMKNPKNIFLASLYNPDKK
jgi:uncharacterized protein YjaZ